MKNHRNILATGWMVALLSLVACVEDNGNYDYHPINEVKIEGINDKERPYVTSLGEVFQITPTLTYSLGEEKDPFTYQWNLMDEYSQKAVWTISEEKNLNFTVGGLLTKDGTYTLMYSVTNQTTGVRYDKTFCLTVKDKMSESYVILYETGDDSFEVGLVASYDGVLTQYNNVLAMYNSTLPRTGRKPVDIICYYDAMSPSITAASGGKKYAVWILTDKSSDRVRAENFEYKEEYNLTNKGMLIESAYRAPGDIVADKIFSSCKNTTGSIDYMYYNGNMFFYSGSGSAVWLYMIPINRAAGLESTPYKVAPYIYTDPDGYGAVLFNETNNRFEWHKGPFMGGMSTNSNAALSTTPLTGGDSFNWANPNYRLVYMDFRSRDTGYAVVKNVGNTPDSYELLGMKINTSGLSQTGKMSFPAGTDLSNVKFYAYSSTLPYLYFATEDKVFRVHTGAMDQVYDITSQVLPAGQKISKMKSTACLRFPRTDMIMLATYDPAGDPKTNGQLAFYEVADGTGDLVLAKHPKTATAGVTQIDMKWTGFGKIVNVDYKFPK